jgi:hypothetical protein
MAFPFARLRLVHLALTPLLGAFVYSPSLRALPEFAAVVQFGAFPLAAAAGLAMWLGPRLLRRHRTAPGAG